MLDTAIKAAREAGQVLLEGVSEPIHVDRLERHDVKLEMDRKAEARIMSVVRERFPDHAILAEESGAIEGESGFTWVIDPLDGTYNFFRRIPFWCTSIALLRGQEEVVGVVYDPVRDELFHTEQGQGAFLNGEPIRVSNVDSLARAVASYAYGSRGDHVPHILKASERLVHTAGKIRSMGSAALHLAYVACGRTDAFFELGIHRWDVAAGVLLIREAGGEATMRMYENHGMDVAVSNGQLHREFLEEIDW